MFLRMNRRSLIVRREWIMTIGTEKKLWKNAASCEDICKHGTPQKIVFMRKAGVIRKLITGLIMIAMVLMSFTPVTAQAASKKTVRVATQKELKKALKNSKVGTIILRTETVDPITITSTKAKKKKLIVDASYSVITNNAKFKSIEVQNALNYIENVSGNSITINTNVNFEIAAGKSVKKVTFPNVSPWAEFNYVVRNKASIKQIAFVEDDGRVQDTGNSTFRIEKSIVEEIDEEAVDYRLDLSFDKDGRIVTETVTRLTEINPDYEDDGRIHIYDYKYDDRGNLSKLIISNPDFAYDLTVETYFYDENDMLIEYSEEYGDRPVYGHGYEYDDSGRMISFQYVSESHGSSFTYSYDKKGRLVEESGTYYDFVYGEDGLQEEVTRTYTAKTEYSKEGYELNATYEWGGDADAVKSVVIYGYDKSGNRISYRSEDYYSKDDPSNVNVYRNEYEYDAYGNLLNAYYVDSDGRRVNMDDIAG